MEPSLEDLKLRYKSALDAFLECTEKTHGDVIEFIYHEVEMRGSAAVLRLMRDKND